jgi:hypothetical protein
MPTPEKQHNKDKPNELSDFLRSLDEETRKLLVKCLHINGESGEALTEKQRLEKLRSALQ